jgi:hypothetical protein
MPSRILAERETIAVTLLKRRWIVVWFLSSLLYNQDYLELMSMNGWVLKTSSRRQILYPFWFGCPRIFIRSMSFCADEKDDWKGGIYRQYRIMMKGSYWCDCKQLILTNRDLTAEGLLKGRVTSHHPSCMHTLAPDAAGLLWYRTIVD